MAILDTLRTVLLDTKVVRHEQWQRAAPPNGLLPDLLDRLQSLPAWYDPARPALTPYQRECIERRIRRDERLRDLDRDLRLNNHLLLEFIGEGGMAVVWKGWSLDLWQVVALKRLKSQTSIGRDEQLLDRQRREEQILSQLEHPHVVKFLRAESSEHDGEQLLAMEFVNGQPIDKYLSLQRGPVPIDIGVRWLTQLFDALAYAHRKRIIHRDLSWKNVMIVRPHSATESTVKLLDFGLSKIIDSSVNISQSQQVIGTPQFMSPEHFEGAREVNEQSDLYSLGCLAYAIFTGETPFNGPNYPAFLKQHLTDSPRPPRSLRGDLPPELERMLLRLLSKDPTQRGTAAEWFQQLTKPSEVEFEVYRDSAEDLEVSESEFTKADDPLVNRLELWKPPGDEALDKTWSEATEADIATLDPEVPLRSKVTPPPLPVREPKKVAAVAPFEPRLVVARAMPSETTLPIPSGPILHLRQTWLSYLCLGYVSPLAAKASFIDPAPAPVDVLTFWSQRHRGLLLVAGMVLMVFLAQLVIGQLLSL